MFSKKTYKIGGFLQKRWTVYQKCTGIHTQIKTLTFSVYRKVWFIKIHPVITEREDDKYEVLQAKIYSNKSVVTLITFPNFTPTKSHKGHKSVVKNIFEARRHGFFALSFNKIHQTVSLL